MRKLFTNSKKVFAIFAFILFSINALAQNNATIAGIVKDGNGAPVANATVTIKDTKFKTTTDGSGYYSLKVPAGNYSVVIKAAGQTEQTIAVNVAGGGSADASANMASSADNTIRVVGSRSTIARTNINTVAPVDAFSAKELASTGQVEVTQMLNYVAPSFNSSRQTIADGTDHIDPATLRGLGPDQVLILVNGRRRYNTALINVNGTIGRGSVGTDLNSINPSSIASIEVLRDGAAAQYGSDAIAGVINIKLKKDAGKTSITSHIGQNYLGDGENVNLGVSHGLKLNDKGGVLSLSGDWRYRGKTNRVGDYTARVYTNNVAQDEALIASRGFSRKNNLLLGQSELTNLGLNANLFLPLAGGYTLTGGYGYNSREGLAAGFYRYPRQTSQVNPVLYPDGFLPRIGTNIEDRNFNLGLEGKNKKGWLWDVGITSGFNSFDFEVKNSNNASQNSLGGAAQTQFYCGQLRFGQTTFNLNYNKDFSSKISGVKSFNVATGVEFRADKYSIKEGEEASWKNYAPASAGLAGGAQVFPGFQPTNAVTNRRNVAAVYVDVESDINEKFLVDVALRAENYSDYGGNVAGKLAARYKLADNYTVRGAVSNGFRAPSAHQGAFSAVSTLFVNLPVVGLTPTEAGTFRNDGPISKAFGIPTLKAETSVNLSLGFAAKPVKGLSITIDAYQINIKNRIVLTGDFAKSTATTSNATTRFVDSVLVAYPAVSSARFFSNAIDTKTQGIDIVATYGKAVQKGRVDLTLAANFNKTTVEGGPKVASNIPASTANDALLFNLEERGRIEQGQPRNKLMFTIAYRVSNVGFTIRNTRFGEVATIFNGTDRTRDEFFTPKLVTDVSVFVKLTKFATLTIGANNIADVYPDRLKNLLNTSDGRFTYSRNATQFGFNGGYYFTSLNFAF